MIRRIVLLGAIALVALVLFALVGLVRAHLQIRGLDPPLPSAETLVRAPPAQVDTPVAIWLVETAYQAMPRSLVLDSDLDPAPDRPYEMSHPSFLLEWADGRLFAIDLGMDREAALAFGGPLERFGAAPIEPLASLAEALGPAVQRVAAVGFTHLHTDHTAGIAALCAAASQPIRVVQTPAQSEHTNYTTRPGREQIEAAPCARPETLVGAGEGLLPLPGFPGLGVVAVAGHTPGSQIFVAHVRDPVLPSRSLLFVGDLVNAWDGVAYDVPKPWWYSLFVVPEAPERLSRLRHLVASLARDYGLRPLISHDRIQLIGSGIRSWPQRRNATLGSAGTRGAGR